MRAKGPEGGPGDNRTEILSPTNEQYIIALRAVPIARRAGQGPEGRSISASRVPNGSRGPEGEPRAGGRARRLPEKRTRAQDTNGDSNYFKIRWGGITVCWDVRI